MKFFLYLTTQTQKIHVHEVSHVQAVSHRQEWHKTHDMQAMLQMGAMMLLTALPRWHSPPGDRPNGQRRSATDVLKTKNSRLRA